VHGAENAAEPATVAAAIGSPAPHEARGSEVRAAAEIADALPPITRFLDDSPQPKYRTGKAEDAFAYSGTRLDDSEELPPVEHFTDPLPFSHSASAAGEEPRPGNSRVGTPSVAADGPPQRTDDFGFEDSGWVDTGWQQFDWNGAAALGEAADPDASDAWSRTEWDTGVRRAREPRETAAQAIASALDEIAQRIRKGEIIVPPPDLVHDPAAIAATLAALLGVRR
jgi:hypothetical protein